MDGVGTGQALIGGGLEVKNLLISSGPYRNNAQNTIKDNGTPSETNLVPQFCQLRFRLKCVGHSL